MVFPTDVGGALNGVLSKFSSIGRRGGLLPNPFFDNATMQLPTNIKEMFKFCRWAFHSQALLAPVIKKLAQYPVTEMLILPPPDEKINDDEMERRVRAWKKLFEQDLRLAPFLISLGYDKMTYGSAFPMPIFKKDKIFSCTVCGTSFDIMARKIREGRWTPNAYRIYYCPKCNRETETKVTYSPTAKVYPAILKLNPLHVDVIYNSLTGDYHYWYVIPPKDRKAIIDGNPDYLKNTPESFVKFALSGMPMRIKDGRMYHMRVPGLSEEDHGYPKPPILPAMREIYQMAVLKRAQEAIALEHVTPLRFVFPQPIPGILPPEMLNLSRWKEETQEALYLWKQDPNLINFSKIPVGVANVGGDARGLFITPEMEYLKMVIINAMEIPREFYEGGTSWSSSTASSRLLENRFLNDQADLEHCVNWLKDIIRHQLKLGNVAISFKRIKTVDDVQRVNTIVSLNQRQKVSDKTMLNLIDLDPESETQQIKLESRQSAEWQKQLARLSAEAQAEGTVIMGVAQVRTQFEQQKKQAEMQAEMQAEVEHRAEEQKTDQLLNSTPEEFDASVMAGEVSLSNVLQALNTGRFDENQVVAYNQTIRGLLMQALSAAGVNPKKPTLPLPLMRRFTNGLLSPVDLSGELQQMAQAAQQQVGPDGQPVQGQPQQGQPGQAQGQPQQGQPQQGQEGGQDAQGRAQALQAQVQQAGSQAEATMIMNNAKQSDPEAFALMSPPVDARPLPEQKPPRRPGS
jgi:hypothetical protein